MKTDEEIAERAFRKLYSRPPNWGRVIREDEAIQLTVSVIEEARKEDAAQIERLQGALRRIQVKLAPLLDSYDPVHENGHIAHEIARAALEALEKKDTDVNAGDARPTEGARRAYINGTEPQDWTVDASYENGNYVNFCIFCKREFMGHKRRVSCRLCNITGPTQERRSEHASQSDSASGNPEEWRVFDGNIIYAGDNYLALTTHRCASIIVDAHNAALKERSASS